MSQHKTNLYLFFSSEGDSPSKVANRLSMIGFVPQKGSSDFVYSWPKEPTLDEILTLGDRITTTLSGSKVMFDIETI